VGSSRGLVSLVDTPILPTDTFVRNNDIQNSDARYSGIRNSDVRNTTAPPDIRGSQNYISGSPDPHEWPNFDLILHLFVNTCCHQSRAKFEVSSFNRSWDIRVVPKLQKWVAWPPHDPCWPNFALCSLVPLVIYKHAKFEFSCFNLSRDMETVQKFTTFTTRPVDLILHFVR